MKPVRFQRALKSLKEGKKVLVCYHTEEIDMDEIWVWGENIDDQKELKLCILTDGEFYILS